MPTKCRIMLPAAFASLLISAAVSNASTSTFSSARLASDGSNLDNKGSILQAINFTLATQSSPTPTPTINGIAFTGFNDPANASSYSGTNFVLGSNPSGTIIRDDNRASGLTNSAAVYPLIYNAAVSPATTPSALALTLSGLTVSQQYEAQFVFSSDSPSRSVIVTDDSSSSLTPGNSGTVNYGVSNGPQVVTGLFTADATSQVYDITQTGGSRVQFSGYTLQAVPEPATLSMIGLAAFGLLARRKRSQT